MKNLAHEEEYKGCKIELVYDESPESPRGWCNVGTMACWHRRYTLGDEQPDVDPETYERHNIQLATWRAALERCKEGIRASYADRLDETEDDEEALHLKDTMEREEDDADAAMEEDAELCWKLFEQDNLVLPLYLYDHSGITISTSKFSCPWDSGRVGFIHCLKERARKEWPGLPDDECFEKALARLRSEVETYDAYLTGQVVGFDALDPDGESIDSVWGFYPDEKGNWPDAIEQAKAAIDHWCDKRAVEATERTYWEARDTITTITT